MPCFEHTHAFIAAKDVYDIKGFDEDKTIRNLFFNSFFPFQLDRSTLFLNISYKSAKPSPGSSVGSDAGCQSRGCEFESRLGQLSF